MTVPMGNINCSASSDHVFYFSPRDIVQVSPVLAGSQPSKRLCQTFPADNVNAVMCEARVAAHRQSMACEALADG